MVSRIAALLVAAVLLPERADAAFGYTTSSSAYTIDSGAGLVFQIRRTDSSSTTSVGDIMSLQYNGVEYQISNRGSQVDSGFDWIYNDATVPSLSIGYDDGNIKVTVRVGDFTHYYIVRENVNRIYMASHATRNTDRGEWRYILRLRPDRLPNSPRESDMTTSGLSVIESGDIQGFSGGETRSKHYSGRRLKDWRYLGVTGTNVGMWLVRDNGEGMAGGPFYKVIQNQKGSNQELTLYWSYGMAQTESYRIGRLNMYTLVVTDGSAPPSVDLSFLSSMSLTGYVGSSLRGRIRCNGLRNRDPNYAYTVGFAKDLAQYYTTPYGDVGEFNMPDMIQGTYTLRVFKGELEVYRRDNLEVVGGQVMILNTITIAADPSFETPVWRIGDWDGTPRELLNGDKVTLMHPSDSRMSDWDAPAFVVGTNTARAFPAYMWQGINEGHQVRFKMTKALIRASHRIRLGITISYAGARPRFNINSWWGPTPSAPSQPNSRSLTTGTYRGNNIMYDVTVPASTWNTDVNADNVLTIWVASGSGGSNWLSPGISIDCVDLVCSNCDVTTGTFKILARHSDLPLGVAESSTANGGNVEQQTSSSATSQQWVIASASDGYYSITNVNSGLAMEVSGQSTANNANIVQYSYWGGNNQQWAIEHIGGGYFSIINRNSELGLDVAFASTSSGANIQQYSYFSQDNQEFYFESV